MFGFLFIFVGMVLQVISAILFVRHGLAFKKFTKEKVIDEKLHNNFDNYIGQMNKEQWNITTGLAILLVSFVFSGLGLIFQQLETFSLVNDVEKELSELKELLTSKNIIP